MRRLFEGVGERTCEASNAVDVAGRAYPTLDEYYGHPVLAVSSATRFSKSSSVVDVFQECAGEYGIVGRQVRSALLQFYVKSSQNA